tara:strand:- start:76453 stop:76560 length:108 start_codon:yes stop_codon:yes gene_type:complete
MKSEIVEMTTGQNVIVKSSWPKKKLADVHLEPVTG